MAEAAGKGEKAEADAAQQVGTGAVECVQPAGEAAGVAQHCSSCAASCARVPHVRTLLSCTPAVQRRA